MGEEYASNSQCATVSMDARNEIHRMSDVILSLVRKTKGGCVMTIEEALRKIVKLKARIQKLEDDNAELRRCIQDQMKYNTELKTRKIEEITGCKDVFKGGFDVHSAG